MFELFESVISVLIELRNDVAFYNFEADFQRKEFAEQSDWGSDIGRMNFHGLERALIEQKRANSNQMPCKPWVPITLSNSIYQSQNWHSTYNKLSFLKSPILKISTITTQWKLQILPYTLPYLLFNKSSYTGANC